MRDKTTMLKDLGLTQEYNPHAGLRGEIKDVVLIEVLIDIRDEITALITILGSVEKIAYRAG